MKSGFQELISELDRLKRDRGALTDNGRKVCQRIVSVYVSSARDDRHEQIDTLLPEAKMDEPDNELRPLREAACWVPSRRSGRPTHPSTLVRWALRGIKGQKLEVTRVGATLCCTRRSLLRFFNAVTAADPRLSSKLQATPANDHVIEQLRRRGLKE